jgi:hypothetical protein
MRTSWRQIRALSNRSPRTPLPTKPQSKMSGSKLFDAHRCLVGSGQFTLAEYIVVFKDSATKEQIDEYAKSVDDNGMCAVALHFTIRVHYLALQGEKLDTDTILCST